MQLTAALALFSLSSNLALAYQHGYYHEARSVYPVLHEKSLYSRYAEPEDLEYDLRERGLEDRDAEPDLDTYALDARDALEDDDHAYLVSVLARELTDLYIRDYETTDPYSRKPYPQRGPRFSLSRRAKTAAAGTAAGGGAHPQLPPWRQFGGGQLFAWRRIYTQMKKRDGKGPVDHKGMDRLTEEIQGHHHGLVISDGSTSHQFDLALPQDWQKTYPSGKDAPSSMMDFAYADPDPTPGMGPSKLEFLGVLPSGTTMDAVRVAAHKVLPDGKKYDVKDFNCKTFVDQVIAALHPTDNR